MLSTFNRLGHNGCGLSTHLLIRLIFTQAVWPWVICSWRSTISGFGVWLFSNIIDLVVWILFYKVRILNCFVTVDVMVVDLRIRFGFIRCFYAFVLSFHERFGVLMLLKLFIILLFALIYHFEIFHTVQFVLIIWSLERAGKQVVCVIGEFLFVHLLRSRWWYLSFLLPSVQLCEYWQLVFGPNEYIQYSFFLWNRRLRTC